jgi:integrase
MRGQTLPPIVMRRNGPNDLALPILRFYIDRIRPLFPRHKSTSALFPSLDCAGTHLCNKTFGNWLLECSTEIGLPLTSHNFRHGRCTIEINDDPACIDRLAAYLGDKPGTIRKYYAFLNVEAIVDRLQSHVASRRAAYCAGRSLAAELAA